MLDLDFSHGWVNCYHRVWLLYCNVGDFFMGRGTHGKGVLRVGTWQEPLFERLRRVFVAQILRFMGDPHLRGAQENVFGNYIVYKGLAVPELRDEILAQLANQVWRNPSAHNAERGWLLLAACLSGFAPSSRLNKFLLK